jgi:hypothetical protein
MTHRQGGERLGCQDPREPDPPSSGEQAGGHTAGRGGVSAFVWCHHLALAATGSSIGPS